MRKSGGQILISLMATIFLLMILAGVLVTLLDYSSDMTEAYVRRVRMRSDLFSLTGAALKYLEYELAQGVRPGIHPAETKENLTDFDSLRIFSSNDSRGGSVVIYDLEYDPKDVNETKINPLSWGPACPYGYMIRATVKNEKTASFIMETVFIIVPDYTSEENPTFLLKKAPLFWRELQR